MLSAHKGKKDTIYFFPRQKAKIQDIFWKRMIYGHPGCCMLVLVTDHILFELPLQKFHSKILQFPLKCACLS